ncbi:hypothetical protein VNO78_12412 [Psophocarpus tetragonolobus]|uniref:TIR domain-containing protein n=1 Tax=Psophocarpus tetragonolobus TaxID=3891 RepID=A0AAN9SVT9_PSOTE
MAEQQIISAVGSSSSPSFMVSSKKYDVFLSFQGEDTRMNFTSHLHEALKQKKVETYIDYWLEKGDEISPALIKAIEDSHVSIVILSENYASSKWCLEELSKILECKKNQGQIVIPVFHNVDPSHVRKQIGSFGKAFSKLEGEPKCNKWKASLSEVSNLAGWDCRNRSESELLKDIVGDVLRKLTPSYPSQLKGLVGIEDNYEKVQHLLKIGSSEVVTIGIWGMGGMGKTTLATAFYAKLSHEFEASCFLINVRENSYRHGLEALRHKLFSELFQNENHYYDAPFLVPQFFMHRLGCKKVLIVLDDVATSGQLEYLIKDYVLLGQGSRVIVTTRNKQIFGPDDEVYEVRELSFHHSIQLFCLSAFGEKQPKHGYEDLSRCAISYCKGIPLALKVLGAGFRARSKEAWGSELRKLHKIPNRDINDGTDVVEGIALDLGKLTGDLNLSSNSFTEMTNLRFLIIHDSSLTNGFSVYFTNGLDSLSYKLRYLRWDRFYLESLPSNFCAEHLVELRMPRSKVKKLWDGVQNLANLKKINLLGSRDLIEIPDLSKAEKLESVSLRYCTSLGHLHPSVLSLPKLTYLDLKVCRRIESLKVNSKSLCKLYLDGCSSLREFSIISEEVIHLGLSQTAICALPSSIWSNKKLIYLSLKGCNNLERLSHDPRMRSITALHQSECMQHNESNLSYLQALLHNIGHFSLLQVLILSGTNVESLPANMKNLSLLTMLYLDGCRKLVSLPELPQSLREVHVDNCTKLISLPELPPLVRVVWGINCTSLETKFTQQIVLQHILQSRIPYLHKHPNYFDFEYFIFPVEHITDQCGFCTAESSITIPYLPLTDLVGFIYCVILSKGSHEVDILCSIYQEGKLVGMDNNFIVYENSISDHVLFSFVKMQDHLFSIPFKFQFDYDDDNKRHQERIKDCGVFPVYSSESGFKLFGNISMENFESESINQMSDNESEPRTIRFGVGGSNNENEQDSEQLLPEEKRRRICP